MSVFLYQGGFRIVQKSGVGQAIVHQKQALEAAHIPVTTQFSADTQVIPINTVFPDSLLKALWARRHGIKIVYYAHSTMEDFRNSFACSNVLAPFFRRWLLLCYVQGDVILTPTEYSKQLLLSYGIDKPVYSISNGVAADYFRFQKQRRTAFRQAYHLAAEAPVVISVGHMIERKGILDYIELARRMPDVTFFWFGYTKPWLLPKKVRHAIHSAPDNLIFAGYVNQDQLLDAYCGADVFAFLSKEETEGIVVLEALAAGTPTVVRDIPVYEGWLKDHESVYKAKDLDSFESTIRQMLDGTLPDLSGKGRAVALERSFPKIGQQLVSIYAAEGIVNETITQTQYPVKRATRAQS
ncbi:MAG: glycosyltransferase [Erysipelotrichaceae bacterium]|nr:glycosyltransferase [Erysipelotrichaceae bacterium]